IGPYCSLARRTQPATGACSAAGRSAQAAYQELRSVVLPHPARAVTRIRRLVLPTSSRSKSRCRLTEKGLRPSTCAGVEPASSQAVFGLSRQPEVPPTRHLGARHPRKRNAPVWNHSNPPPQRDQRGRCRPPSPPSAGPISTNSRPPASRSRRFRRYCGAVVCSITRRRSSRSPGGVRDTVDQRPATPRPPEEREQAPREDLEASGQTRSEGAAAAAGLARQDGALAGPSVRRSLP